VNIPKVGTRPGTIEGVMGDDPYRPLHVETDDQRRIRELEEERDRIQIAIAEMRRWHNATSRAFDRESRRIRVATTTAAMAIVMSMALTYL